jgi:hypothetical protein
LEAKRITAIVAAAISPVTGTGEVTSGGDIS